jgi:hypothetical protein
MKIGSDHAPVKFDTGKEEVVRGAHFHFENKWFLIPSFKEEVIKNMTEAALSQRFDSTLYLWQVMMAKLTKILRGYGANLRGGGVQRRRMEELKKQILQMDEKAEMDELDVSGWEERYKLKDDLAQLYK